MKLHEGKFTLDIRKMFLTKKVVSHCSRVPREGVMTPSQSESKECIDNAPGVVL